MDFFLFPQKLIFHDAINNDSKPDYTFILQLKQKWRGKRGCREVIAGIIYKNERFISFNHT